MDLELTTEQHMLRATARHMLSRYSSPAIVRELEDDSVGFSRDLWREMARADLIGLTIPEEHGGAGQTALESAVLYEELGRALCPSPHFVSAVMAAGALRAAGETSLLAPIASGETIVTCAWHGQELRAEGGLLMGTKSLVPFASSATRILTLAGDGLFLADPAAVAMTQTFTMASDASYDVTFDGAPAERVGDRRAWKEAAADGQIALAACAVGGAARAHEMATEYAKERVQFDRPIGSFQAIAHPLADAATEIEGAHTLVYEAAWARSKGTPAGALAAMAKLYACDVFRRVTKLGHQVLGGIGFTLDIDMQLFFRRAKQLEITWWGPRELEERIAGAELDAQTPFVSIDAGPGS